MKNPRILLPRLQAKRERKRWLQKELADHAKVSVRTVQRAEEGHGVHFRSAAALANALKVRLENLSDNPAPLGQTPKKGPGVDVTKVPVRRNTIVLIPAAGDVPPGVWTHAQVDAISLVPLAGRPVIYWQVTYLLNLGFQTIRIAIRKPSATLQTFIRFAFAGTNADVKVIRVKSHRGPGFTVAEMLQEIPDGPEFTSALIVLGDTAFSLADESVLESGSFVLWSATPDAARWATTRTHENGKLEFVEKDSNRFPDGTHEFHALIGVYHFASVPQLRIACRRACAHGRRVELSHILNEFQRDPPGLRAIEAGTWMDVGHGDNHMRAHAELLAQVGSRARDFNRISINLKRGTVLKEVKSGSVDARKDKFIDEIHYLSLLPEELKIFFPRVVKASTDWEAPSLMMEYVSYPNLGDLFVFGSIDPDNWSRIFERLRCILVEFAQFTRPKDERAIVEAYLGKTLARLEELQTQDATSPEGQFISEVLTGRKDLEPVLGNARGLIAFLKGLRPEMEQLAERSGPFTVIHGDLAFSNIFAHLVSGVFRFVDQRGSFGGIKGPYGAPLYDVAKLYHCVYGRYDFLAGGLFELSTPFVIDGLTISEPPWWNEIVGRFERVFFENNHDGRMVFRHKDTLLVTALLFASMIPLHADSKRRQVAMLLRSLKLFQEWTTAS